MSYEEFRRRIDTVRNILVGAVPSPAGQIDQITYALMYKFMNDIDDQSVLLGGKRTYFSGEYVKYNWHELMSSALGAQDRMELYRQAIQTMSKNENLPSLFREIYQNAFLPFNSANVLNLFLKEMDKFDHSDSDDIGDAYEYLLSITGAQGDVGQFRTPRHVIKFIVDAVNPTKEDSVLDPACGTAGFLIAAYDHVKAQHDGRDENGHKNEEKRLSVDELTKIHKNYRGFDIDPTMVRTAEVNMYLHGFTTPDIRNHDTLSSEVYWEKHYDVILANPPFMTPKGGIQPHKKFSINANRAEVLFVDYIASHINPVSGRAGIVVPEGIIFQSGKAYKDLRKNLVENSLYAVISLPSGIFQPYSGVKTSILLLDKKLAKERDEILFVKIENDGYSLGSQRRLTDGDQFPEAIELIKQFQSGENINSTFMHVVARKEIFNSGDYNLSGDKYRSPESINNYNYEIVKLGDVADFINGYGFKKDDWKTHGSPIIRIQNLTGTSNEFNYTNTDHWPSKYIVEEGDLLISWSASIGFYIWNGPKAYLNQHIFKVLVDSNKILKSYLFFLKDFIILEINKHVHGNTMTHVTRKDFQEIKIPLPTLEIQREIVAELDGYQEIIDAAQTITQNYKSTIKVNPEWKVAKIDDAVRTISAPLKIKTSEILKSGRIPVIDQSQKYIAGYTNEDSAKIDDVPVITFGDHTRSVKYVDFSFAQGADGIKILHPRDDNVNVKYLYYVLLNTEIPNKGYSRHWSDVKLLSVSLPPIEIQNEIVTELENEQELIDANKKLIEIYQQKIKSKLAEIWGE